MILCLDNILNSDELSQLQEKINESAFIDGKMTAGWHASLVKNNYQLDRQSPQASFITSFIEKALEKHPIFQMATLPKKIHSLLVSRYETGMAYGSHVDNALMGSKQRWRSDISVTIFLNSPNSYQGGELVLEKLNGEQSFKLKAGSLVLYPSDTLHRVETVTEGVRLVAVTWIQSLIRDPRQRELLFELDTVRRSLFHKEGKTHEFDLLSKCHANLLRQWAEL